jgi:hypothetical protein
VVLTCRLLENAAVMVVAVVEVEEMTICHRGNKALLAVLTHISLTWT